MRIFHFSNDIYPRVTGGTEIFVSQLIAAQQRESSAHQYILAAHEAPLLVDGHASDAILFSHQRLLPAIISGSRLQQIETTPVAIPGFQEMLADIRPDVVHLHSFSERCGLSHARAAKAAMARLVLTVHAPGFSCIKGNLIDASGAICDGYLRERRCTRCRLHNGGLPRWLAGAVALQNGWPLPAEASGSLAHVLTARQLTASFHKSWLEFAHLADAIHVLATWSRDALLRQGLPASKVHLIHTAGPPPMPARQRTHMQDGVLRLVYWGRCHPVKGLHLVVEAILGLPRNAPVQFDCFGPYWDGAYGQQLLSRINGDRRFRVLGQLPKDHLLPKLQAYDLAVVPSTGLETGPLTVLEAFAAGLPVAGSDLGGIKEMLEGVEGCFRLPLEVGAWRQLLERMLNHDVAPRLLPPPQRSFKAIAAELMAIYQVSR